MYQKYHPVRCPRCDSDLTEDGVVAIHFIVAGGHPFSVVSKLDSTGLLVDVDRLVENGYHAGTNCWNCEELLEELVPAVKRFSWRDLSRAINREVTAEDLDQDITVMDDGEFFRCLSFEQTTEDDVLEKGHWFLRVEAVA